MQINLLMRSTILSYLTKTGKGQIKMAHFVLKWQRTTLKL